MRGGAGPEADVGGGGMVCAVYDGYVRGGRFGLREMGGFLTGKEEQD